ncbi:MAG TPA: FAD-dependent oxidoreductase [Longimicrobiales bacterium]|nr:FAD-dependent oxidoreductase [Longimicrobiales bacterium]
MSGPGTNAKVVVVGGGVIGLSCAYYLSRGGARVVVLERERVGAGASWGNAGTVSPGHPPLNRPGRVAQATRQMMDPTSPLYVHPSWNPGLWRWLLGFARYCTADHVRHAMSVMGPLGKDALALYRRLLREERIECGWREEGYHDVCATEAGLAAAHTDAETIVPYGYAPELLDGDELRRREPHLGPIVIGGVFYPEAATLDPALFLERLARVVAGRGCEIREGAEVRRVVVERGRATGVELASGEREGCDAVVLATGPYALELAARTGTRLPVQPGKGYHRDLPIGPNGAPRLRIACVLNETAVFCTPLDAVVRFAGTMEFSGLDRTVRRPRLEQLTRSARRYIEGIGTARPVSEWCGLRPMSVDGVPIVGPLPGVEGVSVATGHGMLGLTLAPVTGEMIANHVLGKDEPRLAGTTPARFA